MRLRFFLCRKRNMCFCHYIGAVAESFSSSCSTGKWSASARPRDIYTRAVALWQPIKQRVNYKLCLLVHKATVRQAPCYLTGMLTAVTDVPLRSTLRDASNGDYVVHRTCLKFGERAFSVAAHEHRTGCEQNSSLCVPRQFENVLVSDCSSGIALLNWTV